MEKTPFNLDSAIADWRNALEHRGIAPETIEELEGHLAESAESLQASGLSAREAFRTAVDRLGDPDEFSPNAPDQVRNSGGGSGSGCVRALGMAMLLSGVALLLGTIALIILFFGLPVQSSSHTTLQVPQRGMNMNYNTFQQTQFAIIESRKILDEVISSLGLMKRWNLGEESSYERLKKNLRTEGVRGTELIQISFVDPDPELAAQIVNALAQNYRETMGSTGEPPVMRVAIHEIAEASPPARPSRLSLLPPIATGVLGLLFLLVGVAIRRSGIRKPALSEQPAP